METTRKVRLTNREDLSTRELRMKKDQSYSNYNCRDGRIFTRKGRSNVPFLAIQPSGNFIFSVDEDNLMRIADTDGTVLDSISAGGSASIEANQLAFSPGNTLAAYSNDRIIRFYSYDPDTASLSLTWSVTLNSAISPYGYGLEIGPNGHLYFGGYDGSFDGTHKPFRKYDKADGSLLWQSDAGTGSDVRDLQVYITFGGGGILYGGFSKDFGGLLEGSVKKIDTSNGSALWTKDISPNRVDAIAGCKDGGVVIAYGSNADITTELNYVWYDSTNIRKYDKDGNQVWDITVTGTITRIYQLATDDDNNVYISGRGATSGDLFLAKYSAGSSTVDPTEQWKVENNQGGGWRLTSDGKSYVIVGTHSGKTVKYPITGGAATWNIDRDDSANQQIWGINIHPGNPAIIDDWAG